MTGGLSRLINISGHGAFVANAVWFIMYKNMNISEFLVVFGLTGGDLFLLLIIVVFGFYLVDKIRK